ncbi:restriction endonuclease [Psychrobacillus lasiicapitis]|uniref:Restriction endonuclease n=1 Tax=Psychrobacillus lasiicapitis TaxID=1636719 RepID=A0A544T8T8_9BACI|nr:restriction endonuclease [Psychrobacillus lasiicapitis]TQR13860.1 restriction endonuclease [Psychrobacillus lasiicapitis]GGA36055.1 hypothetical protein GCM10011384_27200 [Psychrobacillus lasiicapitis]
MNSEDKIYETLALGMYHRFCSIDNLSQIGSNVKENPIMFESFVALVMENTLGGKATVTQPSGDFGVDIVHTLKNKDTYLAQVKCYNPTDKIKYEPISILHSNIVKRNAVGGYFVTTSDYNDNAKKYAEGLNIKLINGFELAQYWLGEKESWVHEAKNKTFLEELFSGIESFFEEIYNSIVKKVK